MAIGPRPIHDITAQNASQVPAHRNGTPVQFIVIHYLGVPNADNPNLYGGGYGGHYNVTRDGTIYKAANPWNDVVWQCGGDLQGEGPHPYFRICDNYNSIGIENGVCYDSDWYFTTETQESLVYLVSTLMDEFGIPLEHVIRHFDVTCKNCPEPYVSNDRHNTSWTWDEFKAKLAAYRGGGGDDETIKSIFKERRVVEEYSNNLYRLVSADKLTVRLAPDADAPKHSYWGTLSKGNGVYVMQKFDNGWVGIYISAGAGTGTVGYVDAKYLVERSSDDVISDVFKTARVTKVFSPHQYRTVTQNNVSVKLAPSADAPTHPYWGKLSKGNGVQEMLRFGDWSEVYIVAGKGTGTVGYVETKYLK